MRKFTFNIDVVIEEESQEIAYHRLCEYLEGLNYIVELAEELE